MDFQDSPEDAVYRQKVRAFLLAESERLAHAPGEYVNDPRADDMDELRETQAILYDAGYVGVTWPVEYGGHGGTITQQAIVDEELARAGIAGLPNFVGVGMCGPTLLGHGTEEQKRAHISRLLRADDMWCQLFSEPGSGSDLAALTTTARRQPDGTWIVNGQKVWNTFAQYSSYGILLARTEPEAAKHRGLTMFILDMHAPGVTVRPIRQMNRSSEFNEVFLDEVVLGDDARIGAVNDGWRVALTTLMNERVAVGGGGAEMGLRSDVLIEHARTRLPQLSPEDQVLARQALGRVLVESLASRFSGYRRLTTLAKGRTPGPEASAGKLAGVWTAGARADLAVRLLGPDAVFERTANGEWCWATAQAGIPGLAIAGGTDEILRNILGERVLGLPAEPQVSTTGAR